MNDGPTPVGPEARALVDRLGRLKAKVGVAPDDPNPLPSSAEELAAARRRGAWESLVPSVYGDPKISAHPAEVADPTREWVRNVRLGQRTNLVILGPTGTGKSHLAFAALRPLVRDGIGPIGYAEAEVLLDAFRPSSPLGSTESARLRWLIEASFAFLLDEVGAQHDTEFAHTRLSQIVHQRWRDRHPLIVTSNLPLDHLHDALGERAADRLLDEAIVIRYSGASRRGPQETTS